jgi:hypothetical protein
MMRDAWCVARSIVVFGFGYTQPGRIGFDALENSFVPGMQPQKLAEVKPGSRPLLLQLTRCGLVLMPGGDFLR